MGEGIQGNREGIKGTTLFIFDVFDIDEQRYLTPKEREYFVDALYKNNYVSEVVPVYHRNVRLADIGIHNIDDLITFADGKSLMNKVREGLVFKCESNGDISWKVISNKFLLKGGD